MYFTLFGFPKLGHLRCLLSYTFKYISRKANLYSTFKLVEAKCYILTISALWKILLKFFRLDDKNNHKKQSLKKEKNRKKRLYYAIHLIHYSAGVNYSIRNQFSPHFCFNWCIFLRRVKLCLSRGLAKNQVWIIRTLKTLTSICNFNYMFNKRSW